MAGLLAAALLYAGASGFARTLQLLPVHAVLDDLGRGHPVAEARTEAAANALATLEPPDGRVLKRRGQLALSGILAGRQDRQAASDGLRHARQWLIDGLAQAPTDAYAWIWLTQAEMLLHGPTSLARNSFAASLRQSPNFGPLTLVHLDYGLLLWPVLDLPLRAALQDSMAPMAVADPVNATRVARRRGATAIGRFRRALAAQPDQLKRFDYYLAKLGPA
tara:strand:+ start:1928 stop:2587 length:660 start_codon:yes stop_codon:yes gene_type:complete